MSSSITINGNVNIHINCDSAQLEVNDDLTAENITELIQRIFNVPAKEKKLDLNPNAPEFVPSEYCQCECECESDDSDDSDYDEESNKHYDWDDVDIKYEVFKKVCKDMNITNNDARFKLYLRSHPQTTREMYYTQIMKYFLEEEDDGDYGRKRELFKEVCKEMDVKFSHDAYEFYLRRCDGSAEDMSCEKMKDYLNECIIPFMKKSKTPVAAAPAAAPAAPAVAPAPAPVAAPAPAPVEKKEEPKRDAAKVSLFRQLCDENDIDYSVNLFDKYEEWSKSNGSGLNRYKKMAAFLKSHSKA